MVMRNRYSGHRVAFNRSDGQFYGLRYIPKCLSQFLLRNGRSSRAQRAVPLERTQLPQTPGRYQTGRTLRCVRSSLPWHVIGSQERRWQTLSRNSVRACCSGHPAAVYERQNEGQRNRMYDPRLHGTVQLGGVDMGAVERELVWIHRA